MLTTGPPHNQHPSLDVYLEAGNFPKSPPSLHVALATSEAHVIKQF